MKLKNHTFGMFDIPDLTPQRRWGNGPTNKALPPLPPVRPVAPLWLWPRWSAVTRGGNMMEADGRNRREGGIWQIIPPP